MVLLQAVKTKNMKFKCIIFDCDGVLVDSEAISAKIFQEMASKLGSKLDFETVLKQITGTSMTENLKFFSEKINGKLPEDFEAEFRKRSYEAFKTELKPIKGIHELLEKINVPVGVASSGPVEKIKLNLTTTNLIDYFDSNIFSCYEIGSWKPEPEIYLHAAKKMGFQPVECAVIEDSLAGVQSAKAGGFNVFGFAHGKNKNTFEELGATVFSEMQELGKLLDLD
ncbi:MAG TPA: HAD family phosphatase [Draconibacterium sp.]|nr:HAD family phosphatase [Draconibacterium sp.]